MPLHYLLYGSRATQPLTEADLLALLHAARRANQAQQLTGLLYTTEGRFLQVLEGEAAPLAALYQLIVQDLRYQQLRLLAQGPLPARRFTDWHLGFRRAAAAKLDAVLGHVDTASAAFLLPVLPGLPNNLLDKLLDFVHDYPAPTQLPAEPRPASAI